MTNANENPENTQRWIRILIIRLHWNEIGYSVLLSKKTLYNIFRILHSHYHG